MNYNLLYKEIMVTISPILILSGAIAFTLSMIVMLINMLINAASGKGLHIGVK